MSSLAVDPLDYDNKLRKVKYKCPCSHTMIIPVGVEKKVCSVCGHVIYTSNFAKFKGELGKVMKKKFI